MVALICSLIAIACNLVAIFFLWKTTRALDANPGASSEEIEAASRAIAERLGV